MRTIFVIHNSHVVNLYKLMVKKEINVFDLLKTSFIRGRREYFLVSVALQLKGR
jgi:hypothetical protein